MKHKKGLAILIAIVAVSVIFGARSLVSGLTGGNIFSFSFSRSDSDDDDFYDDFDDEFDDFEEESSNPLGRIISLRLGKSSSGNARGKKNPYIAVIHITGVISEENKTYNQKWLLRQIRRAKNDENNFGILLNIDSPGGTVYESDEAYLALTDYARSTGRPVFSYFGSLAASGGYYIGCAAGWIYANRNTLTGSIGVIAGQSVDATALLEKIGVKMTTITAGRNKNMGNYDSVFTEEQREIMQSIADEAYEQFTEIVADSRGMSIEKVRSLADGRIYTAKQARESGLIDEICSLDEAKDDIRDTILDEQGERVSFVDCKYQYEESWLSLLSGVSSLIQNPTASVYGLLGAAGGKCLYLYQ